MAKILVVDDSVVARMCLKRCLPTDAGHEVVEAGGGREALDLFRRVRPDLTFLDLTMEDMHGLEVLEELKKEFPDAAVIILSADQQKKTRERAESLGALSVMPKPPAKEEIQAELDRVLAKEAQRG